MRKIALDAIGFPIHIALFACFAFYGMWVQREKYQNNTHLPFFNFLFVRHKAKIPTPKCIKNQVRHAHFKKR